MSEGLRLCHFTQHPRLRSVSQPCQVLTFVPLESAKNCPKVSLGRSQAAGKETTTAFNSPSEAFLSCKDFNMLCQHTVALRSKAPHDPKIKSLKGAKVSDPPKQCDSEVTQETRSFCCSFWPQSVVSHATHIAETFPLMPLSYDEFYKGKTMHCAKIRVTIAKITFVLLCFFFFLFLELDFL